MRKHVIPSAVMSVDCGPTALLLAGDIIGRSGASALCIDDPGVSEVHAYVSLRGGALVLLGLRGRIGLEDKVVQRIELAEGQTIQLARDVLVRVEEVTLPDRVLALEGDEFPRQVLTGTCSLVFDPTPTLAPGAVSHAPLQFWTHDGEWHVRDHIGRVETVTAESRWELGKMAFRATWIAMDAASAVPTCAAAGLRAPLVLRVKYDSVHIERVGKLVVSLVGRQAQLVSELVAFDGPTDWQLVAEEIWGRATPGTLRPKLDVTLARLRKRLSAAGVRRDLIRADGCGKLELVTEPGDQIEADL